MAWLNRLVIAVGVCATAGCGGPQPPPPPLPLVQPCPPPNIDVCTVVSCGNGGNSPFTNLFPVNGLHEEGVCNKDGIQLMPGTLVSKKSNERKGCAPGSTLALDTTDPHAPRIVGRLGEAVSCEHGQLVDASFDVRAGDKTQRLTIKSVNAEFSDHEHKQEAYLIADSQGRSLCQFNAARDLLKKFGFKTKDTETDIAADNIDRLNDFVVAMPGPVFDQETAAQLLPRESNFFNLACVDDALAKSTFYDLGGDSQETT